MTSARTGATPPSRELRDETGITTPLRELGPYRWDGAESREVGVLYDAISDGPFVHPSDEVAASRLVPLNSLAAFLGEHAVLDSARALVVPHLR